MRKLIISSLYLIVASSPVALNLDMARGSDSSDYIVHEWGTFTSVQGGDGVLLDWRPLQTSVLPRFVHDWKRPGLNRRAAPMLAFGKGGVAALQRMETPVMYFYSRKELRVEVEVKFPQGWITEWYPQARQIGPSFVPEPALLTNLDHYAHTAGMAPSFSFAGLLGSNSVPDSRARWTRVKLLPERSQTEPVSLPSDRSGSHYFSARNTDSDFVQVDSMDPTNSDPETEKFIFYRGVGSFATPLRVTMETDERLAVQNTGAAPLTGAIVVRIDHGLGSFRLVGTLAPYTTQMVEIADSKQWPLAKLSKDVGRLLNQALVQAGLYPREAQAMVATWKDSWLTEDGLRVLYILPRAWTDSILPLELNPNPRQIARVMVGRSEVIEPALQQRLSTALTKAAQGDTKARSTAQAEFQRLGRFAEPALALAARSGDQAAAQLGWTLLQARSN